MPTSTYVHIPTLVVYLQETRPCSILDVGIGNGKMGFLARDLLDVMLGQRYKRQDWRVRIDGIEVFPDYVQDHQRAIYDHIFIGDALDVIDSLGTYDMVILCDVLEHLDKARGWALLGKAADHCRGHVILGIPLGTGWTQSAVYGNPYETHRSFWTAEDLEALAEKMAYFTFPNLGDYGCFLIRKERYLSHRICEEADRLFSGGRQEEAIRLLKDLLAGPIRDLRAEYLLVDLLLKSRCVNEAADRLEGIRARFPEDHLAGTYLDRLKATGREKRP